MGRSILIALLLTLLVGCPDRMLPIGSSDDVVLHGKYDRLITYGYTSNIVYGKGKIYNERSKDIVVIHTYVIETEPYVYEKDSIVYIVKAHSSMNIATLSSSDRFLIEDLDGKVITVIDPTVHIIGD